MFQNHKSKPPPPFTPKENEVPQNKKKKIQNPQVLKKQKILQSSQNENCFWKQKLQ